MRGSEGKLSLAERHPRRGRSPDLPASGITEKADSEIQVTPQEKRQEGKGTMMSGIPARRQECVAMNLDKLRKRLTNVKDSTLRSRTTCKPT